MNYMDCIRMIKTAAQSAVQGCVQPAYTSTVPQAAQAAPAPDTTRYEKTDISRRKYNAKPQQAVQNPVNTARQRQAKPAKK